MSDLPPMPDPETGEPRPPRAPTSGPDGEMQPFKRRVPHPKGQSRPLAWYYGTGKSALFGVVFGIVTVAVCASLVSWGFSWTYTHTWIYWVMIPTAAFYALGLGRNRLAAGADWVSDGGSWVKTYELAEIYTANQFGRYDLGLRDKDGRTLEIQKVDLRECPQLWNLVYNGIRHSIANGAKINDRTRKIFSIED